MIPQKWIKKSKLKDIKKSKCYIDEYNKTFSDLIQVL